MLAWPASLPERLECDPGWVSRATASSALLVATHEAARDVRSRDDDGPVRQAHSGRLPYPRTIHDVPSVLRPGLAPNPCAANLALAGPPSRSRDGSTPSPTCLFPIARELDTRPLVLAAATHHDQCWLGRRHLTTFSALPAHLHQQDRRRTLRVVLFAAHRARERRRVEDKSSRAV
ncbi:hypothetical protein CDD83_3953 [Cordyceps sp. RAO-2017]|nr:hypothetical protein CDD83_3953 [Cordyceps sp. RAO-2017]